MSELHSAGWTFAQEKTHKWWNRILLREHSVKGAGTWKPPQFPTTTWVVKLCSTTRSMCFSTTPFLRLLFYIIWSCKPPTFQHLLQMGQNITLPNPQLLKSGHVSQTWHSRETCTKPDLLFTVQILLPVATGGHTLYWQYKLRKVFKMAAVHNILF